MDHFGATNLLLLRPTTLFLLLLITTGKAVGSEVQNTVQKTVKIPESIPLGTSIGYLKEPPPSADLINFMVVFPPESHIETVFNVNENSGEIRTVGPLDYESRQNYVFLAIPIDGSPGIRVVVEVVDVNDNSPTFPVDSVDVELSEYAKINSEIPLPSATDRDSGLFGVQKYEIVSGNANNTFKLQTKRLNQNLYADLVVNSPLDREWKSHYRLEIRAFDGGNPPLSALLVVNISILDANDNAPIFDQSRYLAQVMENATVGTLVTRVRATDKDSGLNGQVEYHLLPSPSNAHRKFAIDTQSGTITVASALDSRSRKPYELLVVARDKGQQPMESTTFVSINVQSPNENLPRLKITFLSDDGSARVMENAEVGAIIARVSVSDAESKEELNANVTLQGGHGVFGLRPTEKSVTLVTLLRPLDRETAANYQVVFAAADLRTPDSPKIVSRNVTIAVGDVNDNPPIFSQPIYYAEVKEKATPGSSVLQVSASDLDVGDNARLTYSLAPSSANYSGWFRIDSETGLISVAENVDCEVSSKPELTVVATDSGTPPLSGTALVRLSILDVNDNPPVFNQSVYAISIPEDVKVGLCVLRVFAFDPDCGVNSQVRYRHGNEPSSKGVFSVDQSTGTICVERPLDYEVRRFYQFSVSASDGGGLTSTVLIQINIEDVNDNAPVFYPVSYNVSLREDSQVGLPVLIVSALDKDSGAFSNVSYRITSGNEDGTFGIDRLHGEIYLQKSVRHVGGPVKLSVEAVDGGGRSAERSATVVISIVSRNSVSPEFGQSLYKLSVREDIFPGITIGQVTATGVGQILYSIYSGDPDGFFKIDQRSGRISVAKDLDHDTQPSILLNIQASMGNPPSYNHTQVVVQIEDINDNWPQFDIGETSVAVREDHPLNQPIFVARATDKDSGDNGRVKYRLIFNPDNTFIINPYSGELTINRPLDYETRRNYTLDIIAQDGGIPAKSSNLTLHVFVTDVNDNPPRFVDTSYHLTVMEDTAVFTKIFQLLATDLDSGINAQIIYSVVGSQSEFGIYADSGWIYVRKTLDRERQAEYILKAVATDTGHPSLNTTVDVKIVIGDVNDNPPNCSRVSEFSIEENLPANTPVGQLSATDPDEGQNGTLYYALADSSFKIDSNSGFITAIRPFDHETQSDYRLTIEVRDRGVPQLSTMCPVTVHITDVNDNSPQFILPHSNRIYFKEEQPVGTEVTQVWASDLDSGANGSVHYHLLGVEVGSPFKIDPDTGVISTTRVLDFETNARLYQLNILAEDKGTPARNSLKNLMVELVDIDDGDGGPHANVTVAFEISEVAQIGTQLGPVDKDVKDQPEVTYSIVGGNTFRNFEIDKVRSVVFLVKELSYEEANVHLLRIHRIDQSHPYPMVTTIQAKIYVRNENNHSPLFPDDPVLFAVPENVSLGHVVWTYNATDMDSGSNGRILYRIEQQLPEICFDIDSVTGDMWVTKALDFERFTEYFVVVSATDQAVDVSKRRSSRVTTRVYVTDVNDNPPHFVSRTEVNVFEDEPIGFPLLYLLAVDPDWEENGRVSYEIVSGNEAKKFEVDDKSGAVTLVQRLDREDSRKYRLNVRAFDHGNPQLFALQTLLINVEDINDNSPRFEQSVYRVNITENVPLGTFVVQLKAYDSDGGRNKELLYVLPNGVADNKFILDEKRGALKTQRPIDREQQEMFILTVHTIRLDHTKDHLLKSMRQLNAKCWYKVYVRDSSFPSKYDAATVVVTVNDVNDNPPKFADTSCYPISVPENQIFHKLHTVLARDSDSGPNAKITYSIAGGNVDGKFQINPTTGEMSCDSLDRETTPYYNLTIVARDGGSPSLSDQCLLPITVLDTNDNNPHFEQSHYVIEIPENYPVGKSVLTVKATDLDEGPNGRVTYSLTNDSIGMFEIDPTAGSIIVAGPLDFETRSLYSFTVVAADQGVSESRTASAQVTVKLIDINDNVPIFTNIPFMVNISSETPAGQRIIKVTATDADGPGPNSEVFYGFRDSQTQFNINPSTGVISAKSDLSLSSGLSYFVAVTATDKGQPVLSSTGIVEVFVRGPTSHLDPNGLRFPNDTFEVKLKETVANGSLVAIMSASRLTGGAKGIEYDIIGGNEAKIFKIEPWSGKIFLAEAGKLDYEKISTYHLVVVAKSIVSSTPLRSPDTGLAFATLKVVVEDENDHSPQFLQQHYNTATFEGRPKGTFVAQVSAVDEDSGENARITYSIVGGNRDSAFYIDASGTVLTNVQLDREVVDHYSLTVMATDAGVPVLSGTSVVNVNVIDINDNSPTFPPARFVRISEGAEVGSLVTIITANDVDSGPPLVYRFTPAGNPGEQFTLDTFSGRLALNKPLDYETQKELMLTIEASDEIHTAVTKQKILVLDENDNSPEFSQQFYQVSLPENTPGGTSITHVSAADKDSGDNGKVSYTLEGIVPQIPGFWIDPTTGDVFVNNSVKFDQKAPELIQLMVKASDQGKPQRHTITSIQVQIVLNTFEKQPTFQRNFYNFSVFEDLSVHSVIGTFPAVLNSTSNKHLLYGIKQGDPSQMFMVDNLGNLILNKGLDREMQEEYQLEVTVHTRSNSVANSTANVHVTVLDVNDNSPEFEHADYRVEISETSPIGTHLIQLSANDKDAGENGRISYSITSGAESGEFDIHPDTGVMRVKKLLDFETTEKYKVVVRASDNAKTNPKATIATVHIQVKDENDNSPFFAVAAYMDQVTENCPKGTYILTAKASDKDRGYYGTITYSIKDGDAIEKFTIDPRSGEVRTAGDFDYEERTAYKFSVMAVDNGGLYSTVPVTIAVKGVDEYAPVFTQVKYTFQVPIDSAIGDVIGVVYAEDRDAGVDGQVHYVMKEPNSYFDVHDATGVITVIGDLTPFAKDLVGVKKISNRAVSLATPTPDTVRMAAVKKLLFIIIAHSTSDVAMAKANSTSVEVNLGNFTKPSPYSGALTPTTISVVSIIMVILLVLIIIFVALRLRKEKATTTPRGSGKKSNPPCPHKVTSDISLFQKARRTESVRPGDFTTTTDGRQPYYSTPPQSGQTTTAVPPPPQTRTDAKLTVPRTMPLTSVASGRSSGRGSMLGWETETEADEEISRMGPSRASGMAPDSGILLCPDDTLSVTSDLPNTHEYLTSLGVDLAAGSQPTGERQMGGGQKRPNEISQIISDSSVDALRLASNRDQSGTEGVADGIDIHNLIYAKLSEVSADEALGHDLSGSSRTTTFGTTGGQKSRRVRSSLADDSAFSSNPVPIHHDGNNWAEVSRGWGPSYQPLSTVFSEIAKIKDKSNGKLAGTPVKPMANRRTPTKSTAEPTTSPTSPGLSYLPNFASPPPSDSQTFSKRRQSSLSDRSEIEIKI